MGCWFWIGWAMMNEEYAEEVCAKDWRRLMYILGLTAQEQYEVTSLLRNLYESTGTRDGDALTASLAQGR